jgi:hypothetical protein
MVRDRLFGCCFAAAISYSTVGTGEAKMGILILKVLAMWSLVAMLAGLTLGAAIRRGERARKDELLSSVFASVENLQGSRS